MRRDSRDEITRPFSEIDSGMARRAAGGSDGLSEVFVHESAYVDEGAQIGAGTKIWHFCHVNKGAVIGGIMKHIEDAGIHSGDSACVLPP
jgi:hypothetical protein